MWMALTVKASVCCINMSIVYMCILMSLFIVGYFGYGDENTAKLMKGMHKKMRDKNAIRQAYHQS